MSKSTSTKFNIFTSSMLAAGLCLASGAASAKSIGPQLSQLLAEADATTALEVIVTFEGQDSVSARQLDALRAVGIDGGITFNTLPMVGVTATKAQIDALYARGDVRSVWYNAPLQYENEGATQITGVDRLRADTSLRSRGMPYSGMGVGVVINDSGVDGTHGDIKFPNHVIQNVSAQTNLRSFADFLPVTYQEGVPNTDIGGGHGSHVAGIIGGNGSMSGGKHEGVAPGAKLVGYGSGAALFILDTLGGFDYALTHQYEHNIRVISNSFGNTGDTGTDFNPDDPTNVATKALSDRGVIVVFSAGNSGSGEATITGNFKKAPWVVTVAAGDKDGNLADFSSRGVDGKSGSVMIDGETYSWEDRPTITAPGVDIISVRDSTSDGLGALSLADEAEMMEASELPYYTVMSGTSMSAPHVSGIVALMLEANPDLNWRDVKRILQETATNMPGLAAWEAGAGYVNAYAAVQAVVDEARMFGETLKMPRQFNAFAKTSIGEEFEVNVPFSPAGANDGITFEVGARESLIMVRANVAENTIALVLESPSGKRYGSSIALPVLGQNIAVTADAEPGTWTLKVKGIGSLSGVALDPLGVTNGYALPDNVDATVKTIVTEGYEGLNDIGIHQARSYIEGAVSKQLVDAKPTGFMPDQLLTRVELADYLTIGAGIRQSNRADKQDFMDVNADQAALANAVTQTGAALRDRVQKSAPVMLTSGDNFNPDANVSRLDMVYALIQSAGLENEAKAFEGDIKVTIWDGSTQVTLKDGNSIAPDMKGYVQLALDLGIIHAYFDVVQRGFGLEPEVVAEFRANEMVTRADYAVSAMRYYNAIH